MKKLSWAQVIIINATLLTFATYVVLQGALKANTRTTSTAAPPLITPTGIPSYPSDPPTISQIEYWYGKPGDQVRVRGQNFGSAQFISSLFIGDLLVPKEYLLSWTDKIIDFTIPPNAQSGAVTLVVNQRQASGPNLSVYQTPADPKLVFRPTSNGVNLYLANAPHQPLALKVNDKSYTLNPTGTETLIANFPEKFPIETASLMDKSGILLPLYQNPTDLLP